MLYFGHLESLFECWQSKRKTIEISPQASNKNAPEPTHRMASSSQTTCQQHQLSNLTPDMELNTEELSQLGDSQSNPPVSKESYEKLKGAPIGTEQPANEARKSCDRQVDGSSNDNKVKHAYLSESHRSARASEAAISKLQVCRVLKLATCPALLYAILLLHAILQVDSAGAGEPEPSSGSFLMNLLAKSSASPDTRRDRWALVSNSYQAIRNRQRNRAQWPNLRRPGGAGGGSSNLANRIRSRIGARNTIRVHNAFRDFAWLVLSSLSMPTPVIYELRRQNFYSPEDEVMNDSLFNKNTTKTIRSRRRLARMAGSTGFPKLSRTDTVYLPPGDQLSARDDDDDDSDSFRDRLRSRLEDLVSLSRRSLFGQVVRLPSLLPFKRQQDDEAVRKAKASGGANEKPRKRRRLFGLNSRRRRKDADRQMIQINGKQYYVNDDGELKELEKQDESNR